MYYQRQSMMQLHKTYVGNQGWREFILIIQDRSLKKHMQPKKSKSTDIGNLLEDQVFVLDDCEVH